MFITMKKKRNSTGIILLLFMALFLAAAGGNSKEAPDEKNDKVRKLYRIHGRTQIEHFSENVTFGVLSRDQSIFSKMTAELFKDPTIFYVVIYNHNSEILSQNYANGLDSSEFKFPPLSSNCSGREIMIREIKSKNTETFLDVSANVHAEQASSEKNNCLGWVRIGMSMERFSH